MSGKRHAYLIMIHEFSKVLAALITCIDDLRNDIYIHLDKKADKSIEQTIKSIIKKSDLFFVPSVKVTWGSYSQIQAELNLLTSAVCQGTYQYYHLLSGADLPLKSQDEIHNFFNIHNGKEFINFQQKDFIFQDRVRYYYPFRQYIKRDASSLKMSVFLMLENYLITIQKRLDIVRNRNIRFQKGANWFSITDVFARSIVSKKTWIRKVFHMSNCADELLVQTIFTHFYNEKLVLYQSDYNDSCESMMRLINWKRGNPYVFRNDDFEELISSGMLFARKFTEQNDDGIVDRLVAYVKNISIK